MMRPKAPDRIRVDALRVGAAKVVAGCAACGEGYFALARQHGAGEADIQAALVEARRKAEQAELSRRDFLRTAALGTAGLAVATGGGLLPQLADAAAAPVDGAQVAWVRAMRTATSVQERGNPFRLVGVTPAGRIVGEIDPLRGQVLRSPDGRRLCVLWASQETTRSTTIVEVYSAATGRLERTITGHVLALANPIDRDSLTPSFSTDGRFLAVLHQTRRAKPDTLR